MSTIETNRWRIAGVGGHMRVGARVSAVNAPVEHTVRPVTMPASVPKEQIYFWTSEWQENERLADIDIAEGDVVTFDDPTNATDVVHWLLSDDE